MSMTLFFCIIALNISLFYSAPKGFLPEQDTGQLGGFTRGDDGFSFQVMQPKIETYRRLVMADPAVQDVMGFTGGMAGISNAYLMIRLKPRQERDSAREVVNRLRLQSPPVPGGNLYLGVTQDIQPPRSSNAGSYDLAILTSEVSLLREWESKIAQALQELPELTDVDTPNDGGTKQVMLHIDREAAQRLGVDTRMITQVLNNFFSQRQRSNSIVVVVVGDGELRAALEAELEVVIPGRWRGMGFQNQQQLGRFYALADTLVLPSIQGET